MNDELKKQLEEKINIIAEQGIQEDTLDILCKLVDIHKDLSNEEYWKKKQEVMEMMYRDYPEYREDYGNYGRRGVPGTGRGRGYSARGRGRYRGDDMMEEMYGAYQDYSEGKEEYNRGNYGAKQDTMKSLDYMLKSVVEFIEMLKQDASSQEEIDLIKHYSKKISEM